MNQNTNSRMEDTFSNADALQLRSNAAIAADDGQSAHPTVTWANDGEKPCKHGQ